MPLMTDFRPSLRAKMAMMHNRVRMKLGSAVEPHWISQATRLRMNWNKGIYNARKKLLEVGS